MLNINQCPLFQHRKRMWFLYVLQWPWGRWNLSQKAKNSQGTPILLGLEDGSSATEAFTWSGQRSTNRLVPNVRQDMEELYRNYTETMQGSLWVKDCFSQMRFGDARQTLDVHLSKSWIVVSQFRMESKWNKSGDEAKTSAAFFSALVFAAAAWKARSERAPELKHGLGMPSCLNVSKCPKVSILCILQ